MLSRLSAIIASILSWTTWSPRSVQTYWSSGVGATVASFPARSVHNAFVCLEMLSRNSRGFAATYRSEEHTSELQSLMRISYAVFCLKKKMNKRRTHTSTTSNNTQIRTSTHNTNEI